jgi:phage recombination protein Bet
MSNEVVEKDTANLQRKIDLIKRTVAKGATDDEFEMFMHLAKSYQLDPINKEIWFIKYKDNKGEEKTTIYSSRDGYLAIANRNEHYDGMLSDVVHENDKFEKMPDGAVKHTYDCKNRGAIIGAYALGYRNDRKYPIYVFAHLSEYKKNSNVWQQYTSAMILKVAEAMMLKRLFSISGLVTKEEIDEGNIEPVIQTIDENEPVNNSNPLKQHINTPVKKLEVKDEPATQPQLTLIAKQILGSHLITSEEKDRLMAKVEGDLTKKEASEIISWWKGDEKKGIPSERDKRESQSKDSEPKPFREDYDPAELEE